MAAPQLSDRLLTADEFYELEDPREGGKMELICGRVVTHMPVSRQHGRVAGFVYRGLQRFIENQPLGEVLIETGFRLAGDPDTVRAPDVSYVAYSDVPETGFPEEGYVPFPPTLAVEVSSPKNLDSEVAGKVMAYLEAGVKRVWVVRPSQKSVTVHFPDSTSRTLGEDGALTSDDAGFPVEGFALPLADLFE